MDIFINCSCSQVQSISQSPFFFFSPQLSLALTSAFGRDSEGAAWTLNYLLSVVEQTLRLRSSEPGLVEDTVNLLVTMVDSKER